MSETIVTDIVISKKLLYLDPLEISAAQKYNGSRFMPPSKADVKDMAASIRKLGQLQPVLVAKEDGKSSGYRMVLGFTRQAAIVYLNEHLAEGEEQYKMSAIEVTSGDIITLLEANTEENIRRKNLSPMDIAHGIVTFTEAGKADKEIAAIYNFSSHASVTQYRKLITLPDKIQKRVHVGEFPMDAALGLVKVQEEKGTEKMEEVVSDAAPLESPVNEKGKAVKKVKAKVIKEAIVKAVGGGRPNPATGIHNLRELRFLIADIRSDRNIVSGASAVADAIGKWIERSISDVKLKKAFNAMCIEDETARALLLKEGKYKATPEEEEARKAKEAAKQAELKQARVDKKDKPAKAA